MATATGPTIEQRLAALEAAVAEMRQERPAPTTPHWLHRVAGILEDVPEFEKVLDLGRAYRDADRPITDGPS